MVCFYGLIRRFQFVKWRISPILLGFEVNLAGDCTNDQAML